MKTFKNHEAASCGNCGGDLNPSYPKKEKGGSYSQACEKCRHVTKYKIDESAVPANAVAATGGHVAPIGPDDTPPGITALQKMRNAAKESRKHHRKRKKRSE